MSTYQDQKNHEEKFNKIKESLKKAVCMRTIKIADTAFSRDYEVNECKPYFFCSDHYQFDDNQIQCLFCKHGNYYRGYLDFRCTKNDFCTTKIYCDECDESTIEDDRDYPTDSESDKDYLSDYEVDINYPSQ